MFRIVAAAVRGGEWWDHKLVPILTGFYAAAFFLGEPVFAHWPAAIVLLLSLLPGAAFVSIVNDLTDIGSDAAAGKPNRMAGLSRPARAAALGATLAGGPIFFFWWRDEPLLLACYAAAWIAFSLYSVPPARLKARGLSGLLADAAGAHLFPTLLAAGAMFDAADRAPSLPFLAAVGLWAFAYGCRGNAWHQLLDREQDLQSGLATFAATRPAAETARFAAAAFAVELAALAALLLLLATPLPLVAAALYLLMAWRRVRCWQLRLVIAQPQPSYRLWLDDFYGALLPLSILAASAMHWPADLIVLAVHLLLFPRDLIAFLADGWELVAIPFGKRLGRGFQRR